jgi:hypothetical protein
MGVRTRGLDINAGAAKLKADRAARLEGEFVVDRWNRRLATGRDMLWSPTIRAALIAGTPFAGSCKAGPIQANELIASGSSGRTIRPMASQMPSVPLLCWKSGNLDVTSGASVDSHIARLGLMGHEVAIKEEGKYADICAPAAKPQHA